MRAREHLLPAATRKNIVHILDQAVNEVELEDRDLEGLAALALMFQQGVRPGQVILLNLRATQFVRQPEAGPGLRSRAPKVGLRGCQAPCAAT